MCGSISILSLWGWAHFTTKRWPTPTLHVAPSAAKSCERMGRRRRKSDVSRSTRRRHFTGSNRRALKKNNSRSSDVIGQSESTSRSTCKSSVKKPTFKQTRLFQARMFQRNGRTGQIEQSLHGKSLAGKGEW